MGFSSFSRTSPMPRSSPSPSSYPSPSSSPSPPPSMTRQMSPLMPQTQQTPQTPQINTNFNMPPPQQYNPNTYKDPNLDYMANYSKDLMDPNSDYYKLLSSGMQEQIGQQSAAQQRSAALRGAWGGLGGGQGGETMRTAADIGQSGLEAQGQAESGLRLQAPQMGMQGLQSTFAPQLGYKQLNEGSDQFGAGLGESQRQTGIQTGLAQQQMAAQQASQQAQMQMQQQQMQQDAMMQQYAMMYGMF